LKGLLRGTFTLSAVSMDGSAPAVHRRRRRVGELR
jgi:hypothetical protein